MKDFILFGTLVNAGTAALGALIGLLIRFFVRKRAAKHAGDPNVDVPEIPDAKEKPKPFSERFGKAMMKGFALCVLYIGVVGALKC